MVNLLRLRQRLKIIKYLLLIVSASALAFIVYEFSSQENNLKGSTITQITNTGADKANKTNKDYDLRINKTMFEGTTSDLSPYQIAADIVHKIDNDLYKLSSIKGICFWDNDQLKVTALSGFFNQSTGFITLQNNVIFERDGIKFIGDKIEVNISNKNACSDNKINLIYKNSIIRADSFTTEKSSSIIHMKGNVETVVDIADF